ncbi:hypothetical protein LTR09_001098 [Extremus antarcticus]|uniref:Uncharacterized protein n=1 Tax=Extremus antarcticus TaxID=702011 RepID=A0AAJ0GI58_9PEZI|nr:hypothetical protein LTR09_001098 [Extremus antarcticus]
MDKDQVQQEPMSFDEAKSIVKEALAAKMPAYTVEERKELMARMDRRVERMNREEGEVEETAREHEEEATALTNVEEKSADFIEAREEAVAAREKEVAAQEEELAAEKKAMDWGGRVAYRAVIVAGEEFGPSVDRGGEREKRKQSVKKLRAMVEKSGHRDRLPKEDPE